MNISRYLRIPYVLGGRSWDGADCYGLLCVYYEEEHGIQLESFVGEYVTVEDAKDMILEHLPDEWEAVAREDIKAGDAVTFWDDDSKVSVHVGILVDGCRSIMTIFEDGGVRVFKMDGSHYGNFLQSKIAEYFHYVGG